MTVTTTARARLLDRKRHRPLSPSHALATRSGAVKACCWYRTTAIRPARRSRRYSLPRTLTLRALVQRLKCSACGSRNVGLSIEPPHPYGHAYRMARKNLIR
jgi:hypothetical protein